VAEKFKKDARRSEVEEGTGARESVANVVATSPATMGWRLGSHGDAVDGQRHAAGYDKGLTMVRTLSTGSEQRGRDYGWPEWLPGHRRRGSPYPTMLSIRPEREY
jgi:hypothetical protein